MEARPVTHIPAGPGWQYEPKWDGFRCLAFCDGDRVELRSKAGKSLTRYFPDVVAAITGPSGGVGRCVLDGEIVIPSRGDGDGASLSFDQLLQRIHPAASRVQLLASTHPALYIVFDLLADGRGESLLRPPLAERRRRLEAFAAVRFAHQAPAAWTSPGVAGLALSPVARDTRRAEEWLRAQRGGLDGVIAKRTTLPYESGTRIGMVKVKPQQTADCVVGGFRYASAPMQGRPVVGSLLLGLYDGAGLLHHVGFTSAIRTADRIPLTDRLEALIESPGFTGQAPGGPSRWSSARSAAWEPLAPALVVEVTYDHFSDGRFRHGTGFVRWRPDKAPRQCTIDQIVPDGRSSLALLARHGSSRAAPRGAARRREGSDGPSGPGRRSERSGRSGRSGRNGGSGRRPLAPAGRAR